MDTKLPTQQNAGEVTQPPVLKKNPKEKSGGTWEVVKFFVLAAIIVIPIRMYIAQPFIVSGASMDTTFASGEYLIVDEISYRFIDPERGDVIIFRSPQDPSQYFIKRIIALPGETIRIAGNGNAPIIINAENLDGFLLNEPYTSSRRDGFLTRTLGNEEYFVMGDNRAASSDSRVWGPVERDLIIGRAFFRLFPVAKASILPGEYRQ